MAKKKKKFVQNNNNLAIAYYRYSSHAQNDASIDQQRQQAQKYAEDHGFTIIKEYPEPALSGTSDDRPQFQLMLKEVNQIRPAALIVWKTDRIARNRADSNAAKQIIRDAGCVIHYVAEPIPSGTPEGELFEGFLESMAQYYSSQLSQNIRRGMFYNAENCYYNGHPTLGYKPEEDKKANKKIIIDPDTAPVVQRIFADYAGGKPLQVIMNELNAQGLVTVKGKKFTINSLRNILHNEAYIGKYKYGDIVVEDGIPALVSKAQFAEVQERFALNKRRGSQIAAEIADADAPRYWLTGKLYCGHCKESMQGVSGTSKTGAKHYYYYCKEQRHGRCKKKPIRKAVIEYLVQNALRLLLRDTENVAYLAHEAAEYYKSYYVDTGYLEGLESELKAVENALDNLIKALEKGIFGDRLQERMTELENRKKALTATIAAERIKREAIEDEHTIYAYFQKFLNANLDDPEVRDTVLEGLVDKIFLYDGYFEITGFYSDDRTVIEWDEVEDGQIEYSGFIEPADEFADFADGSTKISYMDPICASVRAMEFMCCIL